MAEKRGKRELINRKDGEIFQSEQTSRLKTYNSVRNNLLQQKLDSYEKQRLKIVKTMEKDLHALQRKQEGSHLQGVFPSRLQHDKLKMNTDGPKFEDVSSTKPRLVNFNSVKNKAKVNPETFHANKDTFGYKTKTEQLKGSQKLGFPSIYPQAQHDMRGKQLRKKGSPYMKGIPRTERTHILPPIGNDSNSLTRMSGPYERFSKDGENTHFTSDWR